MANVTVRVPSIGMGGYFSFKEPFNTYVGNTFNISTDTLRMEVVSIISMKDSIRTDLNDPFTLLYVPVDLSETEYKVDLLNDIPIITLSYESEGGVVKYIRIPLNYIMEISDVSSIEYLNRVLVIDLGTLPKDIDLEVHYNDIKDFIATRLGVEPEIRDVTVNKVTQLSPYEHDLREEVRKNNVVVHKTLSVQLLEVQQAHDEILNRLDEIGISLS